MNIAGIIRAIEGKLKGHHESHFGSPATLNDLDNLSSALKRKLPDWLMDLYSWRNGCDYFVPEDDDWEWHAEEFRSSRWMSVSEAISDYHTWIYHRDNNVTILAGYKDSWFPIFGEDGFSKVIDLDLHDVDPELITVDHETGIKRSGVKLTQALNLVIEALDKEVWNENDDSDY